MMTSEDVWRLYNLLFRRNPENEGVVALRLGRPLEALFVEFVKSSEFFKRVVEPLATQFVLAGPYLGSNRFEDLMAWAGETLPLDAETRRRVASNTTWEEFYLALLLDAKVFDQLPRRTETIGRRELEFCRADLTADRRRLFITGSLDHVSSFEIRGWCANEADLAQRMSVELFADNIFIGLAHCEEYRRELQERFGGDGCHGFAHIVAPSQAGLFSVDRWIIAREATTKRMLGRALAHATTEVENRFDLDRVQREMTLIREALERLDQQLPHISNPIRYPLAAYGDYFRAYYQPIENASPGLPPPATGRKPLVSLVIPLVDPELRSIHDAVTSVERQTLGDWELLVVNAVPGHGAPSAFLRRAAERNRRIKLIVDHSSDDNLVRAANLGLSKASGQFVGVLRSGDRLGAGALREMVSVARRCEANLIYTDEDQFDPNSGDTPIHSAPQLKPDFDLDLLLAHNYVGDFFLMSEAVLRAAGPVSDQLGGAAFHDLALRIVERSQARAIRHVPRVLHHRRTSADGAAGDRIDALSAEQAEEAGRQVVACVNAYLERNGVPAAAEPHTDRLGRPRPLSTRVRWKVPDPAPSVSIIIPTRDHRELLEPCIASLIAATRSYPGLVEILVVDNSTTDPDTLAFLGALATSGRARILMFGGAFNWASMNNFAATEARGEILIFLNNDTVAISPEWCSELCSLAARPDVGAVGARLLYADGTIQHAGVIIGPGHGLAAHEGVGETTDDGGYLGRSHLLRQSSAVTAACMATRREVFDQVGGFDELGLKVAFNDTDYCMKLGEAGLKVIYTPFATMYHFESKSRGGAKEGPEGERERREADTFRRRWKGRSQDPFGNPHFELHGKLFTQLRPPPRAADVSFDLAPPVAPAPAMDETSAGLKTAAAMARKDPLSRETYDAVVAAHRDAALQQLADTDLSGADAVDPESLRAIVQSGLFDSEFYQSECSEFMDEGIDPLFHYILMGDAWELPPNPAFSPGVYRRLHMAGAPEGQLALEHYIRQGEAAGLKASPAFDPGDYLAANPPLADFVDRPLFHYLTIGRAAGLKLRPSRSGRQAAPRIAAYLGVKDEVDLLERSIAHLRAIGVDHIMACDMSSTDGSAELLEKYRGDDFSILTLTNDAHDYGRNEEDTWTGHCVRRCLKAPADWVIFLDADEFWLPVSGNLKDCHALQMADAVSVDRFNIVLGPDGPIMPRELNPASYDQLLLFTDAVAQYELQSRISLEQPWIMGSGPPKVMARISMIEWVTPGQHDVIGPAMHRRTADDLVIAHLGLSTLARFERKVQNIRSIYRAANIDLSAPGQTWREHGTAWHWRRWASAKNLKDEFEANVMSPEQVSRLRVEGVIKPVREMLG